MRHHMASICALAAIACLAGCASRAPLGTYVDKDLSKLSKPENDELARRFRDATGETLFEERAGVAFQPFCVRRFDKEEVSWLFLEAHLAHSTYDVSTARAHLFDSDWRRLAVQVFPVGHRFLLKEATVVANEELDEDLLVVKAVCLGPFLEVGGKRKPVLEHGEFQRQFYALLGESFVLVRLEDDEGRIVPNDYTRNRPYKGTDSSGKGAEDRLQELCSSNPVEQLAALVWLSGKHLSGSEPRHPYLDQEDAEDSRVYEAVREDPRTKQALAELVDSEVKWVREYATPRV